MDFVTYKFCDVLKMFRIIFVMYKFCKINFEILNFVTEPCLSNAVVSHNCRIVTHLWRDSISTHMCETLMVTELQERNTWTLYR